MNLPQDTPPMPPNRTSASELWLFLIHALESQGIPGALPEATALLKALSPHPPSSPTSLSSEAIKQAQDWLNRRLSGEPLAYILGEQPFADLSFKVKPGVLIPRFDSECLIDALSEHLRLTHRDHTPLSLLDLACGSGCLGLAMKSRFPALNLTLSDLSAQALALAEENAQCLNLPAAFVQSDGFSALQGPYDLMLCNPPYLRDDDPHLPELSFEPQEALKGGPQGLDFYVRWIPEAFLRLNPKGVLVLEQGYDQADSVEGLLEAAGFKERHLILDLSGVRRGWLAVRP